MSFVALAKKGALCTYYSARKIVKYVYLLESTSHPAKRYVGLTTDLNNRLKEHNAGKSPHTAKFRPWRIIVAIGFTDDQKAGAFERYLKSGSGHAFAKRHFWSLVIFYITSSRRMVAFAQRELRSCAKISSNTTSSQ